MIRIPQANHPKCYEFRTKSWKFWKTLTSSIVYTDFWFKRTDALFGCFDITIPAETITNFASEFGMLTASLGHGIEYYTEDYSNFTFLRRTYIKKVQRHQRSSI